MNKETKADEQPINSQLSDLLSDNLPQVKAPKIEIGADYGESIHKLLGNLAIKSDDTFSLPEKWETSLQAVLKDLTRHPKFKLERFEQSQLKCVRMLLKAFHSGTRNVILEAPTGTGKSIIAMVVSETLRKCQDATSYVLTASKMLQDQMEGDAKEFDLDWVLLKGQANYICGENGQPFIKRHCSDLTLTRAEKEMPCAQTCEYLVTRRACIEADGSILSYAYWLTAMNFVYKYIGSYAPFVPRQLTIFDECHTVTKQVQSMFTVELNDQIKSRMESMLSWVKQDEYDNEVLDRFNDCIEKTDATIKVIFAHFEKLSNYQFLQCIERLKQLCRIFSDMLVAHESKHIPEKTKDVIHKHLQKSTEKFFSLTAGLENYIENTTNREELIVRHIEDTKIEDNDYKDGFRIVKTIILRTLDEALLMNNHVHQYCDRKFFMSATIGDIEAFARLNGIPENDYCYLSLPSTFKYNNCPIYKVKPSISLAAKDKFNSMPILLTRIGQILEKHPNERGIIHSGNFEIARNIKNQLSVKYPRLLFYDNSKEKDQALERLKYTKDGVIVGPSLIEGVSLDDDMGRFQINAKVPYPSLGDVLNKKKLDTIPGWYDYETLQSVIQSFGRTIRNTDDYSTIYLMDSCFDMVFRKSKIPSYISNRIQNLDITEFRDKSQDKDLLAGLF